MTHKYERAVAKLEAKAGADDLWLIVVGDPESDEMKELHAEHMRRSRGRGTLTIILPEAADL
ncbi:MAG: hypothetical protein KF874_13500 [Rhizobiaceae bacterium]|nr:hypothetical protein [Rhizobiaceae bacterium]